MEYLETPLRLKIKDFVDKLQKLECTFLGNKEDSWVMELLFESGLHRCLLIEWMLSKLGCDIGKMFGPLSSTEERMKNLQSTLTQLGFCWPDSVIKGTAEVKEQMEYWFQLIDIICLKCQIVTNNSTVVSDETASLAPDRCFGNEFDRTERKCISDEFEEATSLISEICESVNLKHLLKHDVQLVSPDVQREMKNLSPTASETYDVPSLDDLRKSAKKGPVVNPSQIMKTLTEVPYDEDEEDHLLELNQLEEKLYETCVDFNKAESSFSDLYTDFKPLILNAKSEPVTDAGPAFQKLEPELKKLTELKNSLSQLQSSNSTLLSIIPDLEGSYENVLSDERYANILKLVKDEK